MRCSAVSRCAQRGGIARRHHRAHGGVTSAGRAAFGSANAVMYNKIGNGVVSSMRGVIIGNLVTMIIVSSSISGIGNHGGVA